jgi:hypothetical protein
VQIDVSGADWPLVGRGEELDLWFGFAAARFDANCEGIRPPVTHSPAGPGELTKREREIGSLAAAGRSTKEIAERMCLSRRRTHCSGHCPRAPSRHLSNSTTQIWRSCCPICTVTGCAPCPGGFRSRGMSG